MIGFELCEAVKVEEGGVCSGLGIRVGLLNDRYSGVFVEQVE